MEMHKKILIMASALVIFTAAAGVKAAVFDFANIADGVASSATLDSYTGSVGPGPFTGELGAAVMNFSSGGFNLTATGVSVTGAQYNPYLDSSWFHNGGGGQGGLGVCANLNTANHCSPSSDDNVTLGEVLVLEFGSKVTITDITFRNGEHNPTFDPNAVFGLVIDGFDQGPQSLVNLFTIDLTGKKFELSNIAPNQDADPFRFYISTMTVVPVPAAAWLFATGLIGLVAVARRRI